MSLPPLILGILALCATDLGPSADGSTHPKPAGVVRPLTDASRVVRIAHVRVEAAGDVEGEPASLLMFTVENGGDLTLRDVDIEIAFLERVPVGEADADPRVVVGPFTIRMNRALESGYSASYELLLKNLSADCGCVPRVIVTSARQAEHVAY